MTHHKRSSTVLQSAGNHELAPLFTNLKTWEKVNAEIRQYLPTSLAPYCHLGSVKESSLVILVQNSAVATQLRFYIPSLLERLKKNPTLSSIQEIHAKVHPNLAINSVSQPKQTRTMARLSQKSAQKIVEMAQHLEQKLQEIMLRISRRT